MKYTDIHRNIVEDCKAGKRTAQYELYKLYSKAMYNICLRMLNNRLDAEDILQNSFIDVFSKLHYFRYDSSIGAWIKRIVINNCINYLKKKRLVFEDMKDNAGGVVEEKKETACTYEIEQVKEGITQLSDGYRVVLSLYLLEGYDHKEIAEILNISESTSKSQYSRAKGKLRHILMN